MKLFYHILLFLFVSTPLFAQEFLYNVDVVSYFDNREYSSDFQKSQTIMGVRLAPEIGLGLTDDDDSKHRVMVGLNYIQPMGASFKESLVIPTAYYRYEKNGLAFHLGAIPFTYLSENLPDYLMYDSLVYYHPNIQGGLFQYHSNHGYVDFICDWRGKQTEERNEAFRLILNGRYENKIFYAGGLLQMNHLASKATLKTGVCDDLVLNPYLGLNLSSQTPLDSLSVKAGYILEYEWNRQYTAEPSFPQGFHIDLFANWKRFGCKNTLYIGDNLYPLYPVKGNLLNQGDPFFQSTFYNRTDLFVYLLRNSFVNCYFSWNLHYTKEAGLDQQQQLIVRFNTNGFNKKDKLKNIFGK